MVAIRSEHLETLEAVIATALNIVRTRPQRNSIATFRPSTYPVSLKPLRNAARRLAPTRAELLPRNPTTGIARLLRPRRERPRRRAAEQHDELAPSHCLMLPVLPT
jgi:hypothetical protein